MSTLNCHTEEHGMKHLLNGVAIAAVLAIAAPAWAQAPMTPSAPAPAAPPAAASAAPAAPTAAKQRHHRPMRHAAKGGKRGKMRASAGNSMTEQLNREELARISGGAAPEPGAMPGAANAGAGQGGPRASGP
jgi:hypothetical protein